MTDNWTALKDWVEAEQAAASADASRTAKALQGLAGAPEREWVAAVKEVNQAHGRAVAFNAVAQKMRELEWGSGDA